VNRGAVEKVVHVLRLTRVATEETMFAEEPEITPSFENVTRHERFATMPHGEDRPGPAKVVGQGTGR
jgi:hypothetical protein